jgi:hypothetical protein
MWVRKPAGRGTRVPIRWRPRERWRGPGGTSDPPRQAIRLPC